MTVEFQDVAVLNIILFMFRRWQCQLESFPGEVPISSATVRARQCLFIIYAECNINSMLFNASRDDCGIEQGEKSLKYKTSVLRPYNLEQEDWSNIGYIADDDYNFHHLA